MLIAVLIIELGLSRYRGTTIETLGGSYIFDLFGSDRESIFSYAVLSLLIPYMVTHIRALIPRYAVINMMSKTMKAYHRRFDEEQYIY